MADESSLRRQLTAFVLVGGVSAVVDFGLLTLGMYLGAEHTIAKALSWVGGTVTAYLLNARYTFTTTTSRRSFAAVMVLYLITFAVQVGLFALGYPILLPTLGDWTAIVCFVFAQAVATTINFLVQRLAIYR